MRKVVAAAQAGDRALMVAPSCATASHEECQSTVRDPCVG